MLIKIRKSFFNSKKIAILNNKVVIIIVIFNLNKYFIIIKQK